MDARNLDDRIDQGTGKAKQWAGRAAGARRLEREGRTQSAVARVKIRLRQVGKDIARIFRARGRRRL